MSLLKRQLPTNRPAGPGDAPLDEHLIQGQSPHHAVALDGSPLRPEALALLGLPLRRDPHVPVATPCFQTGFSFDHLVGTGEEPVRNREAERRRGLQIDRKAEARRLLKR